MKDTWKYLVLVPLSLLWLFPIYLLVVNAITPISEYQGGTVWWPTGFGLFENLAVAAQRSSILEGMLNSVLYATAAGLLAVVLAAIASFAVTIMPTRRPALWFWVIYSGTLLPLQIFLAPLYRGYAAAGLYDTQMGMVLIYTAICIPFAFFLVRNYLTTVAKELSEAAQLDGASWVRMFVQVHLPIIRSSLIAAFVFQFTWVWNDLLFGITLSTSPNIRPVMVALAELTGGLYNVGPPVALAAALVISLPTIVLFLSVQKFFASSLKPVG